MERELELKLKRVTSWLKKMYGYQCIPLYPVNAKTVDYLYGIMERNEARDRDLTLLIEETKQQTAKYKAEANYLQGVLRESLGISPFTLSKKGMRSLNTLVSSAVALETKDTSLTNLFCAINDMTSELYATESKNKKMKLELANLSQKITAMLVLESNIKNFQIWAGIFHRLPSSEVEGKPDFLTTFIVGSVVRVEEPGKTKHISRDFKNAEETVELRKVTANCRPHQLTFLQAKSVELKVRIKDTQEEILATGLDRSVMHDALMNLSEELAELRAETTAVRKKLKAYRDLPPSIYLAQVKIEEVKRELKALDIEITREIDKLLL